MAAQLTLGLPLVNYDGPFECRPHAPVRRQVKRHDGFVTGSLGEEGLD